MNSRITRLLTLIMLIALLFSVGLTALSETVPEPIDTGIEETAPEELSTDETGEDAEEEAEEEASKSFAYGKIWSLLPPLIAIVLALITKEVYSSLFIGIVAGGLMSANFNLESALNTIVGAYDGGGGMINKLTDSWNIGILIFLVILGIIVSLVNRAGGSRAYGDWASRRITTRRGASMATFGLGALIFVDDYFNCLTVGSVMRPVTDKHQISRAKLAYIIDATAAPICIIAPISSWAAAVAGVVEGMNGLDVFIRAIPYNFYAILTIIMVVMINSLNFDYGPMKRHEANALNGDLYTTDARPYENIQKDEVSSKGRVIDLVLPVLMLIVFCVLGMTYTGGLFSGASFIDAFANCNASLGLVLGSLLTLIFVFLFYIPRKVITFRQFMDCVPAGFKQMVPAIIILIFAWTLSGVTGLLGADVYVAGLLEGGKSVFAKFMPAIVFLIAVFLSFSTGTSWGTFGILLPIVVPVIPPTSELLIITISACLAGAVCGDHCSPISDTTIMSSTGAQCDHINHVTTQLPYALTVAAVVFVNYIITGFIQNIFICLPIAVISMVAVLLVIRKLSTHKE